MGLKVTEYKIVAEYGTVALAEVVQKWIDRGWQPIGGVAPDAEGYFIQAIVKTETSYPGFPASTIRKEVIDGLG